MRKHCFLTISLLAFAQLGHTGLFTVTSWSDNGANTLRQAIFDANSNIGPDTIVFNITPLGQVHTIDIQSALPDVFDQVYINGFSQQGSAVSLSNGPATHKIQIKGANSGVINCFIFVGQGASSTLRGVVINDIDGPAVEIRTNNVVVEGNKIGTDTTGFLTRSNHMGVLITNTFGCLIGGNIPKRRNYSFFPVF